jgi:superfamily II DNA or RNA helicase
MVEQFQKDAVDKCVAKRRVIVVSPTSSGKSLMMYMIHQALGGRSLVIVPRIKLREQLAKNFEEFGYSRPIQQYVSGVEDRGEDIVITTWQSVYKLPSTWFSQFSNVMFDEVHGCDASASRTLMEKTTKIENKFGFSGSLKDSKTHELVLTGLFGPKFVATTHQELLSLEFVSKVSIVALVFKHPKQQTDTLSSRHEYKDEVKFVLGSEPRNRYIKNLVDSLHHNVLVMYRRIDQHGKVIKPLLEELGREVLFVNGDKETKQDRARIEEVMENNDNIIALTSSGTFSTGISINNIQSAINTHSLKARVDLLQTLGRLMRKDGKDNIATYFDLADVVPRRGCRRYPKGYGYQHLLQRLQVYAEHGLPYKIIEIELKM